MGKIKLVIIFLIAFSFMGIRHFPEIPFIAIISILGLSHIDKGFIFIKTYRWIFVFLALNILSCYIFRDQSFYYTLCASRDIFSLLLVFYFIKLNYTIGEWERILFCLSTIFCICFIIQYLSFPDQIFGGEIRIEYDERRITIFGQGFASLSVLFGINKFQSTRNPLYLILTILGLFCVIGCGYRSILVALIISVAIMELMQGVKTKNIFTFLLIAFTGFYVLSSLEFVQQSILDMQRRNETLFENDYQSNVRYIIIGYYYTSYFKSPIEMILGSGLTNTIFPTAYAAEEQRLRNMGFYWMDDGILGYSWVIGIPIVLLLVVTFVKIFMTKLPKEYTYLRVYFVHVIYSSFTCHELYFYSSFVIYAILLCMFHTIKKRDESEMIVETKYTTN